ncbi:hypothetical protein AMAG_15077 [Allomyces macrogynus ATCC 38327]|uniref:Maintenance of telomere capping protein 6 n=1 Tax=Allomyces macrogynus (strain ATCC 38327) TaxID=578462 RepID=A0A0L0T5S3_ALLM3|nr:hypothetical protein AMAG_15077 [Allomyces macrogynus ATCC 38327]|eukprot:KNE70097.1 hypothetical protein AMAG_15077 [Allomyces macrogynus ATCC 38327]
MTTMPRPPRRPAPCGTCCNLLHDAPHPTLRQQRRSARSAPTPPYSNRPIWSSSSMIAAATVVVLALATMAVHVTANPDSARSAPANALPDGLPPVALGAAPLTGFLDAATNPWAQYALSFFASAPATPSTGTSTAASAATPSVAPEDALVAAARTAAVALRSQRELQLTLPVAQILQPAVDLTAFHFAGGANVSTARIDAAAAALVLGARRIAVDLFWDANRVRWQLCPAEYPYPMPAAVNATRFVPGTSDVWLDLPVARARSLGLELPNGGRGVLAAPSAPAWSPPSDPDTATVVCHAVPGADWPRFVQEVKEYVGSLRSAFAATFHVVELRLHDLQVTLRPPDPAANVPLTPTVTTSVAVVNNVTSTFTSTIMPTAAATEAVPNVDPLGTFLAAQFGSVLLTPANLARASGDVVATDTSQLVQPAGMANQPINAFENALAVDAKYRAPNDGTPLPTLFDLIRVQPRRLIAFTVASDAVWTRPPTGLNWTTESNVLFRRSVLAPVLADNSSAPALAVPGNGLAGLPMVSGTDLALAPSLSPAATSAMRSVLDCPGLLSRHLGTESMPFQSATSAGDNLTASFLQVADTRNSPFTYDESRAVAGCGYAPRLASTAANLSSPASSLASAMLGSIWSWHTLQPINSTVHNCALASLSLASRSAPVHSDAPDFKLPDTNVSTSSSAPNTGPRWVAARCLDLYYTACQSTSDPHIWALSPTRYAWPEAAAPAPTAGRACPDGFTFAVPRTPLQNWMLGRAMATKGVDAAWCTLRTRVPMGAGSWGRPSARIPGLTPSKCSKSLPFRWARG